MITSIIRKEIQIILKEKGAFFWLIGLPILFILLFASIFGNTASMLTIHYLDNDGTKASQQLISTLGKIKGFELKTDTSVSLNNQIQSIKDGKLSSLLVIPQGFETALQTGKQPAEIDFYRDAADDTAVAPIYAVLQNVASGYREGKLAGALASSGMNEAQVKQVMLPPVSIRDVKENAAKMDMVTQVVPGYTVMFVFFINITMVRRFIKDKESGILSRLRSTPMKPYQYLIGMWVPNIIVILVQCAVLLGFGKLVYHLNLGNLTSIILIVLALAICATGIGLALSMLVKSENQGISFTQLITMGGAALGGLWVPYDLLPKFAQTIGRFTPQYWAQHSFQDIMIRGAYFSDEWITFAVLIGFGIVGLLVGIMRFKRFLLTATN